MRVQQRRYAVVNSTGMLLYILSIDGEQCVTTHGNFDRSELSCVTQDYLPYVLWDLIASGTKIVRTNTDNSWKVVQ